MAKVKVHYVGKGVYEPKEFIKEAEEYGVSRAFPTAFLKGKIEFGDKIYTAQWSKTGVKDFQDRQYTETKSVGTALVFGYFVVEGVNLPSGVSDYVADSVGASAPTKTKRIKIKRKCGKYDIISVRYTTASMKQIGESIEEAKTIMKTTNGLDKDYDSLKAEFKEAKNQDPIDNGKETKAFKKFLRKQKKAHQFKTFVTGKFVKLDKPIKVKGELFCRTIREMNISADNKKVEIEQSKIQGIDDYEQVTYYPKGEKVVGVK